MKAMKDEITISRDMQEKMAKASLELCETTVIEGHNLADSPGGTDEFWVEMRLREFGVTPTLAHILTDSHRPHEIPLRKPVSG